MKRPNRHSNPNQKNSKRHRGKFLFIRKKRSETRELLKAVLS